MMIGFCGWQESGAKVCVCGLVMGPSTFTMRPLIYISVSLLVGLNFALKTLPIVPLPTLQFFCRTAGNKFSVHVSKYGYVSCILIKALACAPLCLTD